MWVDPSSTFDSYLQVVLLSFLSGKFDGLENVWFFRTCKTVPNVISQNIAVPFITKWWIPENYQGVLVARVDLDIGWRSAWYFFRGYDGDNIGWFTGTDVVFGQNTDMVSCGRFQCEYSCFCLMAGNENSFSVRIPWEFAWFVFDDVSGIFGAILKISFRHLIYII